MKIIGSIIAIIILGYIMQLVTPWWGIVLAVVIVTFIVNKNYWSSFVIGFLGVFILWGGFALFKDLGNASLLSSQVGDLLGGLPGIALVALTGALGGLLGGLSGMLGYSARELNFVS